VVCTPFHTIAESVRTNGQNDTEVVVAMPGTAQVAEKKHDQNLKKVDHLLGAPVKVLNRKSPDKPGP
jgi:hypothetical protein